jgi:glycine cleavage system aminomethyltransferase T
MEAGLEEVYSLTKGCYIGQEVVARVTYRGHVNRKLAGFAFPDARIPAPGAPVRVDGKDVGRITSAVVSPALGRGVALGYLRREHWEPGTRVEVAGEGEPLQAEVAALPFYRRD